MKKIKLFLAAFAAMVGLSASAQTTWTGVSEITSGQEYYIVNDATGLFVTPGNNWGTRATLDESPAGTATVTLADGKYTIIFTWPSHGNGLFVDSDDGSNVYCDRNAQANYFWTITSNGDNTFNIQLASDQVRYNSASYLTAESEAIWANVQYNSGNAELRKWRFISPTEVKSRMSSSTSKLDVSLFVHGAQGTTNLAASNNSFDRFKERYSWTVEGAGWKGQNNQTLTGFNRYWLECWNNESLTSRSAKKTVSSLPAGSYTLSAYTVGGNGVTFYAKVGEGEKITAATGNGTPILSTVNFDIESESANVEIGIESTAESTSGWIAIDNIKLEYVSFSAFRSVYEEALQAAQDAADALDGFSVYATEKSTLEGVISSNTLTGDDLNSRSALTAATTALENATATVAAKVAACQQYATIVSAIDGGTNVNLTSYVVNAGFEQGNLNGWTSADAGGIANNANFSQKVGTYFVERWQANNNSQVQLSDGTLTHDPIVLPAGIYEISATGQVQEQKNGTTGGGYFLCANSERVEMGAPARYSTYVVVEDKSELIIKFALDGCTGNWISCDDVQLTYVGTDFPAYTLVDGKMSATAATAQSNAETTFNNDKTVANYNALIAAITAAQASKDAYAIAAAALADAKALQTNYTFVTPAAATTFAEAIAAIETPYNEGSLADANASAAGRTLGVVMVDWHASATNTAASNYMISAWPSTYTINDWSWEGNDDGSNFKVPFFQDWIADGESLAAKTMTGTLTGLENGLYSVTAWVRVRAKDGTAATAANGITMDVNAGTSVDVTEGTQVGSSQFQLKEYTAQGLVKDGNLTLNFNVLEGNNISWLSYKNITFTKVRDLTPEEMAVVPADLAIDATSTVFKGKTATLTATSTTEGASIDGFVNWTSDNTSVATVDANGVVTGVAYGTANITATSSLNSAATATCAVTVTAPLITDAANLDFAEGPVVSNHIRTYAKDKTGTDVAQMQEVTGWSIVSNGDAKAAGVMAYGSSYGMGSNSSDFYAPATNPDGQATGNVMGMVGVWSGSVQYVQNVKLPAGAYTITVPVYRNGGANALTKNLIGVILDNGTEYLATTTVYDNSWKTETIKFTVAEETYGRLSLGLNAPNNGSADCQRLWIDGVTVTFEPFATAEEIAALNAAITTAEGYALGFDKDDYAPYKNVAAVTALATAKALDTTNPIAQSDVTNATTALTYATWTANTEEVNAVYDGTFAAAENNGAPAGWTMSNNTLGGSYHARAFVGDERLSEFNSTNSGFYLRFDGTNSNRGSMYYYGNTAGYTVPLKDGVTYYVKVDVAGWGSTGKPIRMNVTGPEGFTSVGDQVNTSVQADNSSDAPQQIFFTFTASVAGNYVINFQTPGADTNTHAVVISNVELKRVPVLTISEEDTSAPTAIDYANVTLTRTLKGGQWNGFSAPFGFTIAGSAFDGAQVKQWKSVTDNEITLEDATEIVAGDPYLVKPAIDIVNPTFSGVSVVAATDAVKGTGDYTFQAHLYATDLATDGSVAYVSTTDSSIKKLTSGSIKGLRSIFNIPTGSNVKALTIQFEDSTDGILTVDAEGNIVEGAIYNLAGQRISAPKKGVNIVNGKKVLVK